MVVDILRVESVIFQAEEEKKRQNAGDDRMWTKLS